MKLVTNDLDIPENERMYSSSKKSWCKKTTVDSTGKLFSSIENMKKQHRIDKPYKLLKDERSINFARHLKLKNCDFRIDVLYEWDAVNRKHRVSTDDLKYGSHLEIVFSNNSQCFTIKDLYKLREKWLKKRGKSAKDIDNTIKRVLRVI